MPPNFTLSWQNLTVDVAVESQQFWGRKTRPKRILDNEKNRNGPKTIGDWQFTQFKVSGTVHNGALVAIMGSSGAGKTTFLAALSGRLKNPQGVISLNSMEIEPQTMKNLSGYLFQDCVFIETLTVLEQIKFAAALKLSKIPKIERVETIKSLLQSLSLSKCQNSQIKVISGGEKKRLALAIELLNDPDILYCDEPTTGLDSYNAITVVEKLEDISKTGKMVIITIHQPSSQLYFYFNHLILLSFGSIIYQGNSRGGVEILEEHFLNTSLRNSIRSNNETRIICANSNMGEKTWPKCLKINNCFSLELYWLILREAINIKRTFISTLMQFTFIMISALIVSTIYKNITLDEENSVQNVTGLLYFLTTELLFTHVYTVINTFPGEFCIFLREKELYSTHSYFASKLVSMIPRNFIQPAFYLGINFLFVEFLTDFVLYIKMVFVMFFACLASSTLGLCISSHFESLQYMDLLLVPFDAFSLIITGAVLNVPHLPNYVVWVKYLSPFSYTYESLAILQWSHIVQKSTEIFDNTTNLNSTKILNNTDILKNTINLNGTEILQNLGYPTDEINAYKNIFHLCLLTLALCVIGWLGLIKKKHKYSSY